MFYNLKQQSLRTTLCDHHIEDDCALSLIMKFVGALFCTRPLHRKCEQKHVVNKEAEIIGIGSAWSSHRFWGACLLGHYDRKDNKDFASVVMTP